MVKLHDGAPPELAYEMTLVSMCSLISNFLIPYTFLFTSVTTKVSRKLFLTIALAGASQTTHLRITEITLSPNSKPF